MKVKLSSFFGVSSIWRQDLNPRPLDSLIPSSLDHCSLQVEL